MTTTSDEDIAIDALSEYVDLSARGLSRIPSSVLSAHHLTALFLADNALVDMPVGLASACPGLKTLHIHRNRLKILNAGDWHRFKALDSLWMSHNRLGFAEMALSSFPLATLKDLRLGHNLLEELPLGMWFDAADDRVRKSSGRKSAADVHLRLSIALESLDVSANGLAILPKEVARCERLTRLDAMDNELRSIPMSIAGLTALRELDLSRNALSGLPRNAIGLAGCGSQFVAFNVSNNLLTSLDPIDFSVMKKIEELRISDNRLERLPDSIFSLTTLKVLHVKYNNLFALPPAILKLTNLTSLEAENNEFLNIEERNLVRIKSMQKALAPPSIQWRRARVLVLGDQGAGSTSLCASLAACGSRSHQEFEQKATLASTYVRGPGKSGISLWDFAAGIGIEHSHVFLLDDAPGIVILTFNLSARPLNLTRIRTWLSSICARSPSTSVLLVGTHSDQVPGGQKGIMARLDSVQSELKNSQLSWSKRGGGSCFPLSMSICEADARSKDSCRAVYEVLFDLAQKIWDKHPHFVPPGYPAFEKALRELQSSVLITRGAFERLCAVHGIAGGAAVDAASRDMHSAGAVYHSPVVQEYRNILITEPSVMLRAVSMLLQSPHMKNGVLKHHDLFLVWMDVPSDLYGPLLALCEHFELSFRLHNAIDIEAFRDGSSLFPMCITDERDAQRAWKTMLIRSPKLKRIFQGVLPSSRSFARVWDFHSPAPDGLFERVLVRVLRSSAQKKASQQLLYSSRAVVLARDDGTAVVVGLDATNTRIVLEVHGQSLTRLLSLFVDIISRTVAEVSSASKCVDVLLPCTHCRVKRISPPTLFNAFAVEQDLRCGNAVQVCYAEAGDRHHDVGLILWTLGLPVVADLPSRRMSRDDDDMSPPTRRRAAKPTASPHGVPPLPTDTSAPSLSLSSYATTERRSVVGAKVMVPMLAPDLYGATSVPTLSFGMLELGKPLGRGLYTTVTEAKMGKERVAVKQFHISTPQQSESEQSGGPVETMTKADAERELQTFRNELRLFDAIGVHPNIVQLKAVVLSPPSLIMSFENRGDLQTLLLDASKTVSIRSAVRLGSEVANALVFLHALTPVVIHGDLKSVNVLLRERCDDDDVDEDDGARVTARLADLGEARVLDWTTRKNRTVDQPRWLAPEVLDSSHGYTHLSDVYSLGMVLWELVSRGEPFGQFSFRFDFELEDAIINGLRPTIPDHVPEPIVKVINEAWEHDPTKRPLAAVLHIQLVHEHSEGQVAHSSLLIRRSLGDEAEPLFMAIPELKLDKLSSSRRGHRRFSRKSKSSRSSASDASERHKKDIVGSPSKAPGSGKKSSRRTTRKKDPADSKQRK